MIRPIEERRMESDRSDLRRERSLWPGEVRQGRVCGRETLHETWRKGEFGEDTELGKLGFI